MSLQQQIEFAYETRETLSSNPVPSGLKETIYEVIDGLDKGVYRIAEKKESGEWQVHAWLKKAVLLFFQVNASTLLPGGFSSFYDKVPLKYAAAAPQDFQQQAVRIVPPATIRFGAYIGPKTVVMPSYINIGAYIDTGCMIDTWATVGSGAQIGKNVHLSGGAGIGGVLEPLQARPTIIEDNVFIGARSEIVEGVIVETGAVLSMGVFISQSTPIYNRMTDEISYGKIPPYSVVVPGNLPAKNGKYSLYCAVIVKTVDAKTKSKINLNELLRDA